MNVAVNEQGRRYAEQVDCKIRSGYRVIGNNTADGRLSSWYFPDLENANSFAKQLAKETKKEVDVVKYLGSWRVAEPPTEFVPALDDPPPVYQVQNVPPPKEGVTGE